MPTKPRKTPSKPAAKARPSAAAKQSLSYAKAGVSIDEGNAFVDFITERVGKTYSDRVVKLEDGFAGMFAMHNAGNFARRFRKPILCAGTDGVGTKLKLAFALNKHDTVGIDLVAMCVNDLLCIGAAPLFFLDYIGTGKLEKATSRAVLTGIIDGCMEAGCALLGGETAEMPGMYPAGEYDLAGFGVGAVESGREITGARIRAGDVIIGLPSSGAHSNGFSLIRAALMPKGDTRAMKSKPKVLKGQSLGDALMTPTRIYVMTILRVLDSKAGRSVSGLAHVTGGGIGENLERILPHDVAATIDATAWPKPAVFGLIREAGNVEPNEMFRVFNMGIGYMLVVRKPAAAKVMAELVAAGEKPMQIGRIVKASKRSVTLENMQAACA